MVQAESWLKKHKAHRSYSEKMDATLYSLYFPSPTSQPWHELMNSNNDTQPNNNCSNLPLEPAASSGEEVGGGGDDHVTEQVNKDFSLAHENNEAFETFDDINDSDIHKDEEFFIEEYVNKELNYDGGEE